MNSKETVKYFYEQIFSKNLMNEIENYVDAKCKLRAGKEIFPIGLDGMKKHITEVRNTYPDFRIQVINQFFENEYGESLNEQSLTPTQLLENMNLMIATNTSTECQLNYAGVLLFAKRPQIKLPVFLIKAVAFYGTDITDDQYIDSRDIAGKLSEMFAQALSFCMMNIRYLQNDQGFNSIGEPEIPKIVF